MAGSLLIGYYGDDFTGSTDALEALVRNGVKTILFLSPPSREDLERFPDIQGIGIAGVARSLPPDDMEAELLPAFGALRDLDVSIAHYKTCSTFDSSPQIGSIGKAIEMGRSIWPKQRYVPLVVGVPQLRRYTVFGNHFAASGESIYRLDRHPVMHNHPVTPMHEADLIRHLSRQTDLPLQLMSIVDLSYPSPRLSEILDVKLRSHPEILLFDVLDVDTLKKASELIWKERKEGSLFVAGSSGIEYGLTAYWQEQGWIKAQSVSANKGTKVDRIAVLSGSRSRVTQEQIEYAENHGFRVLRVPVEKLTDDERQRQVRDEVLSWSYSRLSDHDSIVVHTGSEPRLIGNTLRHRRQAPDVDLPTGSTASRPEERIGSFLGEICRRLVEIAGVRRIVVAGGDTSGSVVKQLSIYALELVALIEPGVPLCIGYSHDPVFDRLELVLKGGQMGGPDYFTKVRDI